MTLFKESEPSSPSNWNGTESLKGQEDLAFERSRLIVRLVASALQTPSWPATDEGLRQIRNAMKRLIESGYGIGSE